jgi:hypothetical protein
MFRISNNNGKHDILKIECPLEIWNKKVTWIAIINIYLAK